MSEIDYHKIKIKYPTYKDIANSFSSVYDSWLASCPIVDEPINVDPSDTLTGKVSDYVKYSYWNSRQTRNTSVNFGIKYKTGLIVRSPDLIVFAGDRRNYAKMYTLHLAVLLLCVYQTNLHFPRSSNNQIVFGDCGGNHTTHIYHNHLSVLDINYPTFKESNTHYRVNDSPLEKIWKEDHYPYRTLIPGVVDLDKLNYFFRIIKKCFPYSAMRVNAGLCNELKRRYDYSPVTCSDDQAHYNHDKHCHIELGRDPDYEVDIGEV